MKKFIVALCMVGIFSTSLAFGDGILVKGRRVQPCIDLPLQNFVIEDGSASTTGDTVSLITTSTTPNFEHQDLSNALVWADGETSPVQTRFRVPWDYDTNGRFLITATNSNVTTPNRVDFDVYINRDGSAEDYSATNETAVAFDDATAGYVDVVSLYPTDEMKPGDSVLFRMWRDDANATSPDANLEVKGVSFCYDPIGL